GDLVLLVLVRCRAEADGLNLEILRQRGGRVGAAGDGHGNGVLLRGELIDLGGRGRAAATAERPKDGGEGQHREDGAAEARGRIAYRGAVRRGRTGRLRSGSAGARQWGIGTRVPALRVPRETPRAGRTCAPRGRQRGRAEPRSLHSRWGGGGAQGCFA